MTLVDITFNAVYPAFDMASAMASNTTMFD